MPIPKPLLIERIPHLGTNVFGVVNEMTAREFVETDFNEIRNYIAKCVRMHDHLIEYLSLTTETLKVFDDNIELSDVAKETLQSLIRAGEKTLALAKDES